MQSAMKSIRDFLKARFSNKIVTRAFALSRAPLFVIFGFLFSFSAQARFVQTLDFAYLLREVSTNDAIYYCLYKAPISSDLKVYLPNVELLTTHPISSDAFQNQSRSVKGMWRRFIQGKDGWNILKEDLSARKSAASEAIMQKNTALWVLDQNEMNSYIDQSSIEMNTEFEKMNKKLKKKQAQAEARQQVARLKALEKKRQEDLLKAQKDVLVKDEILKLGLYEKSRGWITQEEADEIEATMNLLQVKTAEPCPAGVLDEFLNTQP